MSNFVQVNITRNTQRSSQSSAHQLVAGQFIITPLIEGVTCEIKVLVLYPYFNAQYCALCFDGEILDTESIALIGVPFVTSNILFRDLSRLGVALLLQESYHSPVTILRLEQTEERFGVVQGRLIMEG